MLQFLFSSFAFSDVVWDSYLRVCYKRRLRPDLMKCTTIKKDSEMLSSKRKFLLSLITLLGFLLLSELLLELAYFHYTARSPLAWVTVYNVLTDRLAAKKEFKKLKLIEDIPENTFQALWTPLGKDVLKEFSQRYEDEFDRLANEAKQVRTKLIVVYIPTVDYSNNDCSHHLYNRSFYRNLCQKQNLDFLDLTNVFSSYDPTDLTLLPENGHFSRFGNKIIARELSEFLKKYNHYRSQISFDERPMLLGDLRHPGTCEIVENPYYPYRLTINNQGFRMQYDLSFPKEKQRILILGDSFTYGPWVHDIHTYPYLLQKIFPDKEIINAGKAGYTISDELSLFSEAAKYVEPDITVLQVLDNDLYGLFYFKMIAFDRKRRIFEPSEVEKSFLNALRKQQGSVMPTGN